MLYIECQILCVHHKPIKSIYGKTICIHEVWIKKCFFSYVVHWSYVNAVWILNFSKKNLSKNGKLMISYNFLLELLSFKTFQILVLFSNTKSIISCHVQAFFLQFFYVITLAIIQKMNSPNLGTCHKGK
jgi:hypothetical protein